MKEVFLVKSGNKSKAEDVLKKDDLVSRGSITIKSAGSLDIKEDSYFFMINGSEEIIKKSGELLKGLGEVYKGKENVIKKIEEQEDSAIEGFGNILG